MMSNHREREFFMERTLIYTADNSIVSMPVSRFLKQKGFSSQNLVQLKKDPSAVLANGIPCFMNHILQPGDTLTLHIREDHSSEKIPPVNLPLNIVYEDADLMVINKPVTSKYNHLVTSFGLKALAPVYELMNQLIESGNVSKQKFSADPRPLDPNVPSSFLQDFVFKNFMYSKQDDYEKQLTQLGIMEKDAYTCTCYMDEVGNTPAMGAAIATAFGCKVIFYSITGKSTCTDYPQVDKDTLLRESQIRHLLLCLRSLL